MLTKLFSEKIKCGFFFYVNILKTTVNMREKKKKNVVNV